ncbi:MAG TPA: M48 family metalloprotease [Mariprofundaceae bacterium]|nr:M48 family metalloprotease [Mariprofundaceae bacterium]
MKHLLAILLSLLLASPALAFDLGGFGIGSGDKDSKRMRQINQVFKLASAMVPISDQEEIILGKRVAAKVIERYGIENAPEMTYYLNLITTAIAQRSNRPNIPYHVAILATDDVNAYACPGGYIFVTRGVLNMVRDEAELAGVLAHEISHVTERHIVNALRNSKLMKVGTEVAADAFKTPGPLLDQMTNFATDALFEGLDKSDEYESDELAIDYLDRIGYDYPAMYDVLKLLEVRHKYGATKVLDKTHPTPKSRLQKLKVAALKLSLEKPSGIRLPNRFATHSRNHKKSAS